MKYFLDTYALIEQFKGSRAYQMFLQEEAVTSILNVGEFYSYLLREGIQAADYLVRLLSPTAMQVELDDVIAAMKFRFQNKGSGLSFIDCVGYVLAQKHGLIFLTGDPAFKGMPKVELVE